MGASSHVDCFPASLETVVAAHAAELGVACPLISLKSRSAFRPYAGMVDVSTGEKKPVARGDTVEPAQCVVATASLFIGHSPIAMMMVPVVVMVMVAVVVAVAVVPMMMAPVITVVCLLYEAAIDAGVAHRH